MTLAKLGAVLGVGLIAFASTNVDDLLLLMAFFAAPEFASWRVVAGQMLGMGALLAASYAGSYAAVGLAGKWIGLLGLVPLGLGIWRLRQVSRATAVEGVSGNGVHPPRSDRLQVLSVALVTIADGGDNIATYVPLFSEVGTRLSWVLVALFLLLTVLWCGIARYLVRHPQFGVPLRRLGGRLLPLVLIGVGLMILGRLLLRQI